MTTIVQTLARTLMVVMQRYVLQTRVVETTIFSGMAVALAGNLLMGTEEWALLGGTLCAGGILAMFAGIAAFMLVDGLES